MRAEEKEMQIGKEMVIMSCCGELEQHDDEQGQ